MSFVKSRYQTRLKQVMAKRQITDLTQSAIVFAPHPDDETLGCGGTIIRKKAAGADVKVVFLTDGSRSHAALIAKSELRKIRRTEAIKAAQALGIGIEDVIFLEFEDGRLRECEGAVCDRIQPLLAKHSPAEVFIPYALEPPADHVAAYRAVMAAIRQEGITPTVYSYPIWYWQHWPWTYPAGRSKRETLKILKASVTSYFGNAVFKDFQHAVYVKEVLGQKQKALNHHVSQMQRRDGNPNWPILKDVSRGDLLDCFFQDYEIFHRV